MEAKTIGYLVIAAAAITGGFILYNKLSFDKSKAIDALMSGKFTSQPKSALMTWQDGFIKAWYNASKQGIGTFKFENKTYATQGGSATK